MLLLTTVIIILFIIKRYFPLHKIIINRVMIGLSIWLVTGLILKQFDGSNYQKRYTDVEYASVFIKDNPELKARMKIQDDGSVKIIPRRGKPLYLKHGVISMWK